MTEADWRRSSLRAEIAARTCNLSRDEKAIYAAKLLETADAVRAHGLTHFADLILSERDHLLDRLRTKRS